MRNMNLEDQVREAVLFAIGYLENNYLNDDTLEPISIERAVKYVYSYFIEDQGYVNEFKRNTRFFGKERILKMIEEEILTNEYIKIKNR